MHSLSPLQQSEIGGSHNNIMVGKEVVDTRTSSSDEDEELVCLQNWMEDEFKNPHGRFKESIVRKTTVAYGIVELLIRSTNHLSTLQNDELKVICLENFAVRVFRGDIKGLTMLSSGLSLSIEEPSYLNYLQDDGGDGGGDEGRSLGRYLEVEVISEGGKEVPDANGNFLAASMGDCESCGTDDEEREKSNRICFYLITKMIYELFTSEPLPGNINCENGHGPSKKRAKSELFDLINISQMQSMGVPLSICRMMLNLLESAAISAGIFSGGASGDAYKTLKEVGEDLHLLLFDPDRFLFDKDADVSDYMPFFYKKDKLYGRDAEEDLITDAFCRVTRGKSEAFFIGGFSGSGKSMLVNSLRARVKVVGGYVIQHKFDASSQDRPLSGVMSAVDQLCGKLKRTLNPQRLADLVTKIKDEFGADIGLLVRMLPSINVLSPDFVPSLLARQQSVENVGDMMNAHSVCFTLLRFMRIISSPRRPIMLFLDDLQWADDTALDVVHTFLSDQMGSCCIFFIGTYRNNEVDVDHALFDFMEKLDISGVPTTKVSLTGLSLKDLNSMISDALCLYPRVCMSLSKVVFQKTKGNPFFALEFIESLQSRGLLYYDCIQKRWLWNVEIIMAEDITNNVLHLLSSKMNGLSDDVQTLLKAMACFGTSVDEFVIGYLSEVPAYAGVEEGLTKALDEGYVERDRHGNVKFVHDKVREASYDLILEEEKTKFHYDLGKALLSVYKGRDVGDTLLVIASQINQGKESIEKNNEMCISMAKVNLAAGKKAIDSCRHKTASSYLETALSLLPDNHWSSNYDLSLQLSFLAAIAANSSFKCDESEIFLKKIFEEGHSMKDKLPSYHLLVTIFLSQGKVVDAYNTCSTTLSHLGETVPETVAFQDVEAIVPETLQMVGQTFGGDDEWLKKDIENESVRQILKFYTAMVTASYIIKPPHVMAYFVCKMVQLSLQHGVSKYTPLALLQLANIVYTSFDNAPFLYQIAKSAVSLSERFNMPDQQAELRLNFYMGPGSLEPFHDNAEMLRGGFQSGLSSGNANMAFYCAVLAAHFSLTSGEKELGALMMEIDHYLQMLKTYKSELAKNILLCIRETVSFLIDKGEATSIQDKPDYGDLDDPANMLVETFHFHQMLRNYWQGYTQRCQYFVEKYESMRRPTRNCDKYIIKGYQGLNLIDMVRQKNTEHKREQALKIIEQIKIAAFHSEANHRHMLELLEAECEGVKKKHDRASVAESYDEAIASARISKFIHEEGLACEKAGFYHKRMKNDQSAVKYFRQARECYEKWGSNFKVAFVQGELDRLGC